MTCGEIGGGESVENIDGDDLGTTPSNVPHSEHCIALCGYDNVGYQDRRTASGFAVKRRHAARGCQSSHLYA
jgi:hypothetical protein